MSSYHSLFLNDIKKKTGCSYVAFENYKDIYHLKFTKNGKTTFYKLQGTPNDITPEKYAELLDLIIFGEQGNPLKRLGNNE